MKIHGLQKMTLLDFPGKVACIIFTAGCNLRCPFCHNAFLVTKIEDEMQISKDEVLAYIEKRKGILDGVCISGGEPLLHNDIFELFAEIKKMGLPIKLDTNGTFPDRLKKAVEENWVDYVAMDIKNTDEKYGETVGIEGFDTKGVNESIDFLLSGKVDYEFRTTVVKEFHTAEDIENIAKRIKGAKRYFLQSFADSGNLIEDGLHGYTKDEMEIIRGRATQYLGVTTLRG